MRIEILPVEGLPEVTLGDDLATLIMGALAGRDTELADGDVLVVAQKVVSKAEGKLRDLGTVVAGARAHELAPALLADPRAVQAVLDESVRIVRQERVLIVETGQGFICANAGIDHSNVPGDEVVSLLPDDCDESASRLRDRIHELTGRTVGVIVTDTFGRPWRLGLTNVALGIAGTPAAIDYRGQADDWGRELEGTVLAVADELAGAAELVMGKTGRVPVAIVRGYHPEGPAGSGQDLVRPPELDLFR
ncbi:MAG: coenzyme F420-0:L-glutamate ligase [Candidatus Dormibacteraceae bacterium]